MYNNINKIEKNNKLVSRTVVFISMILIVSIIATFLIIYINMKINTNRITGLNYITEIFVYICTIPIIYFYAKKNRIKCNYSPGKGNIKAHNFFLLIAICFTLYIIISNINTFFINLIPSKGKEIIDPSIYTINNNNLLYYFIISGIIGPIYEELIFRKIILMRFRQYGDMVSIIVSSLFFSLFHCNISQFLFAFMIGLMLGYICIKYNRIVYSIIIHSFINILVGLSYINTIFIANNSHKEFRGIYSSSIIILFLIGLVQLIKRKQEIKAYISTIRINFKEIIYLFINKYNIILILVVIIGTYINTV